MQQINGVEVLTTVDELVAPTQTAIIVIDMQNYAISAQGGPARAGEFKEMRVRLVINLKYSEFAPHFPYIYPLANNAHFYPKSGQTWGRGGDVG